MFKKPYIILIVMAFMAAASAFAQESQAGLESKRKKLEDEIAYTNKLLQETKNSKQITMNELRLIDNKISNRNELVATLKKEIYYLNTKINHTQSTVNNLNDELTSLKEQYVEVAYTAYKYTSAYNRLIFLFSADDINQAYQRIRYLDQISAFIRSEAETIKRKESVKEKELLALQQQKAEKKKLLDKENDQVFQLEREKIRKNNLKADLSGKEQQLRKSLRKKEDEARKLKRQIERIIANETKPKTSTTTGKAYALTPAEKKLSESFSFNKGKLPWPTERGVVSGTFGVHAHAVLRNVKTKNNGIDIVTSHDSEARCVFDGVVVSVTTITASNIAVIVKHGNYFTVYSNLDDVYVKRGDQLKTKEVLGRIHTNLNGKTELHFEVWKEKTLQNPAYWLSKK